jgi:hypothetical protein
MSAPLLHVAAFWVDGDQGDEIADLLAERKIEGSRGAVVTFSMATANDSAFRHTMAQLDLAEVNEFTRRTERARA